MPAPILVTQVREVSNGPVLYQSHANTLSQAVSQDTAAQLKIMMRETIRSGTARKTFRRREDALQELTIGGKTGSIGVDPRYDWFVGFAQDEDAGRAIAMGIMVAHEKYIGTRSMQYAKMIMQYYFKADRTAQNDQVASRSGA